MGFVRILCVLMIAVLAWVLSWDPMRDHLEALTNQIARRFNSGGGVYLDEMDKITAKLTEISKLFGNILERLSKIK